jgi:hypothetical protein
MGSADWYTWLPAAAKKATDAKFVELAVQVLQQQPTGSNRPLRAWAIEVVDSFSVVKMSDQLGKLLRDSIRVGDLRFDSWRAGTD